MGAAAVFSSPVGITAGAVPSTNSTGTAAAAPGALGMLGPAGASSMSPSCRRYTRFQYSLVNFSPALVRVSSRTACWVLTSSSSNSTKVGAGACSPSCRSVNQRSSWFMVAITSAESPSRIVLATSSPAVALARLLFDSVLWFCPSSAMLISERQYISSRSYRSALAPLSPDSRMSMLESSGMAATASCTMASSLSSRLLTSLPGVPRGCLPTSQGVPYFSVKVTQNLRPPRMNVSAQKHMDRSANP